MSSANASIKAQGSVRLWYYQSNNCSDSPNSGFEVDLALATPDGTPYAAKGVAGYGFTGEEGGGLMGSRESVRPRLPSSCHVWSPVAPLPLKALCAPPSLCAGSCENPGDIYRHVAAPANPSERFNIHW
jgi:hypothetical protein